MVQPNAIRTLRWKRRPGLARAGRLANRVRCYLELETLETRFAPAGLQTSAILPGFDAYSLGATDDGSAQASLGFTNPVSFFGSRFSSIYVNNNGNLTFNSPLVAFTPFDLTKHLGTPVIAPFFADVWTFGNSGVVQYGTGTVDGHNAFGAEWPGVSYYSNDSGDKLDTFQVVLIDRSDIAPGDFDIEFNYGSVQWESGDKSGGTNGLGGDSAHIGYSAGTGLPGTFFELPGSGVAGSFLDSNETSGLIHNDLNSTVLGRYILPVRLPPSDIGLSSSTVSESSAPGTVVGELSTVASPGASGFVYSLIGGNTGAFTIQGDELVTATTFNFQANNIYSVTVRSTDSDGLYVDKTFAIQITEAAPTDISLNNSSIPESAAFHTVVGNLTTTTRSAESPGSFTYTLVGGDTNAFAIGGSELLTNTAFNFAAQNTYNVTIQSTNASGLSFDKEFTITITQVPPVITLGTSARAIVGAEFTFTGSIDQPGPAKNTLTAAVDYGDNGPVTATQKLPALALAGSNPYSLTLNHTYTTTGDFTVTVYVYSSGQLVGTQSMVVHVVTAQQAAEILSSDTETVAPDKTGTAQAAGSGNTAIQATLDLQNNHQTQPATLWVVNYKGNPTGAAGSTTGTIEISGSAKKSNATQPLAFYDVRISGVSTNDTQSDAMVTYTVAVPAASVSKDAHGQYQLTKPINVLFFDGKSWQTVKSDPNHPELVVITPSGHGFVVKITVTYNAFSSPTISELDGTVFTAALPAPPPPAPTTLPVTVAGLSAYPNLATANFASSTQATVIFRVSQVNDLTASVTELSTRSGTQHITAATAAEEGDALARDLDIDWLMRFLDGRGAGPAANPIRPVGQVGPEQQHSTPTSSVAPASEQQPALSTDQEHDQPPDRQDQFEELFSSFNGLDLPAAVLEPAGTWQDECSNSRAAAIASFLALAGCYSLNEEKKDKQAAPANGLPTYPVR